MEEVKFGQEVLGWSKGMIVEGTLVGKREDVGKYNSTIYLIRTTSGQDLQYWGSRALDNLMEAVTVGQKVKIECTDDNFKFTSGQTGKAFKVWKE